MDFTREPIIETIISAREGYKLSVRNSKKEGQEEVCVDAVEVVSYGNALFYRHRERGKVFFVPVSDYELVEVREMKLFIKNPMAKESIKIGGGKEKESNNNKKSADAQNTVKEAKEEKREKKKPRRSGKKTKSDNETPPKEEVKKKEKEPVSKKDAEAIFSHLLRPPENLISDSLQVRKRSEDFPSSPAMSAEISRKMESKDLELDISRQEDSLLRVPLKSVEEEYSTSMTVESLSIEESISEKPTPETDVSVEDKKKKE